MTLKRLHVKTDCEQILLLYSTFFKIFRLKQCFSHDAVFRLGMIFLLSQGIKIYLCRPRIKFWQI